MSAGEQRLLCEVVKSPRLDEMYLYLDKARGMAAVPQALQIGRASCRERV